MKQIHMATKTLVLRWNDSTAVFCAFFLFKLVFDHACTNAMHIFSINLTSQPDSAACAVSWLFYLIQIALLARLARKRHTLFTVLYLLLFAMNGVGYFVIYGRYVTMGLPFFLLVNVFWFLFTLCGFLVSGDGSGLVRPAPINRNEMVFFAGAALISLFISGVYGGFRFGIAFSDVYAYRMSLNMPTIVGYLFRFASGVFLPYLFTRFLVTRRWIRLGMTAVLAVLLYSVDGLKTNLVLYAVIVVICVLKRYTDKRRKSPIRMVVAFVSALTVFLAVNHLLYRVTGKYWFVDESYRVLAIPCAISNNYYNYISPGEPILLRDSILRAFFESPYPESLSYLVTDSVTEYGAVVANTGMIGDAYANFKLFGILTYPVLYSLILWLWQKQNRNEISAVTVSLGFIMLWNGINVSFFTWLVTGGVLVYFFVNWLFRAPRKGARQ